MLGSYGVVEIPELCSGGEFRPLFDVQAIVNHMLSTMVHDGAVVKLVVAQGLQRPNQCLPHHQRSLFQHTGSKHKVLYKSTVNRAEHSGSTSGKY